MFFYFDDRIYMRIIRAAFFPSIWYNVLRAANVDEHNIQFDYVTSKEHKKM